MKATTVRNPHAIARLAKPMIEHTVPACTRRGRRSTTPAPAITAPLKQVDPCTDPDKGLLEQRDRYIAQSAGCRDGAVPAYPST